MPVIDFLSEAIKLGSKYAPLDANAYAAMSVSSQTVVSIPALQPGPTGPIPVLPLGAPAAFALNKLSALPGEITKKISEIIANLQKQFIKLYEDAKKKRLAAKEKLFVDLKAKQVEIKNSLPDIEKQIEELKKQLVAKQAEQKEQLNKYEAIVFGYKEKILSARAIGDVATEEDYLQRIDDLNPWLEEILLMLVEIVNLKIMIANLELELETKKELANIKINKIWDEMVDLSLDFEVAVPPYPDIPDMPSLPEIPKFPELPAQVRTLEKQFAKWVTTPTIPPLGLVLSSILLMITESVANVTAQAAKSESEADAALLKAGGAS